MYCRPQHQCMKMIHRVSAEKPSFDMKNGVLQHYSFCSSSPQAQTPSKSKQLQKIFKEYGKTAFCLHSCVYVATLSCVFGGLSCGLDVTFWINKIPFIDLSRIDPLASTAVLSFLLTATTGPLRGILTISSIRFVQQRLMQMKHIRSSRDTSRKYSHHKNPHK